MKTLKIKPLFLFIFGISLFIYSCSSDDDSNNNNNTNNSAAITEIQNNVQSGDWRITNFVDSGVDETTNFTGYTFVFNSNGVLNAINDSNNYEGTWSITNDNDDDDDNPSDSDIDFNINFNLTNNFNDLNDDWDIVSQTETKIVLIDISGGNGGTDNLTFEKN